jgi:hypothetical protein
VFESFTYTDWLLIVVLWFQVAIVLSLWWPRLSRLRHHGIGEEKVVLKGKDAYEKLLEKDGGE